MLSRMCIVYVGGEGGGVSRKEANKHSAVYITTEGSAFGRPEQRWFYC